MRKACAKRVLKFISPRIALFLFWASLSAVDDKSSQEKRHQSLLQAQKQEQKEHHISQKQAEELFADLEKILKFVSEDTSFPIQNPVKPKLGSRNEVQHYIEEHFKDDEDAKRMQRSELVLKKFGLLPREFDLRNFLVSMLREQVAGFYDQKTKQMYLLDWLDVDAQRPVMAHELTHALQDQNYDLQKWRKGIVSSAKTTETQREIDEDEESSAATAVIEGQGMIVLLDYMLQPSGHNVLDSPQVVNAMRYGMETSNNSPIFNSAPLLLRESLVFPYRDGMGFIQELFFHGGRKTAFQQPMERPPRTTHHILYPKAYLNHEDFPPVRLPSMKKVLGNKYEKYDVGSVGQFDVAVLLKEFANVRTADKLTPESLGGSYFAAQKKGSEKDLAGNTSALALLYISSWKNQAMAQKFAGIYSANLLKKYKSAAPVSASSAEAASTPTTRWNTEEGPVYVEPMGSNVLVMEGFDEETASKLRNHVLSGEGNEELTAGSELSLRYTSSLRNNALLKQMMEVWARRSVPRSSYFERHRLIASPAMPSSCYIFEQ